MIIKKVLNLLEGFILLSCLDGIDSPAGAGESALVTNIMKNYVESGECPPGFSIAMLRDGEIIYSKGFGYSDVEVKKRISRKTKFRADLSLRS